MLHIKEAFLLLILTCYFNDGILGYKLFSNNISYGYDDGYITQTSGHWLQRNTSKFPRVVADEGLSPGWLELVNDFQSAMLVIGILVNVFTVITLSINGNDFTPVIRTILKHQSSIDTVICICSVINLVTKANSLVGDNIFSLIICQAWHSQVSK